MANIISLYRNVCMYQYTYGGIYWHKFKLNMHGMQNRDTCMYVEHILYVSRKREMARKSEEKMNHERERELN